MADVNGSKSPPDANGCQSELEDLIAQATLKYSVKDYESAAELYSKATEMQAQLHGEMAARNADLLYAYGRCLFHLAVRSSDVLGSKVAGEKQQAGPDASRNIKKKKAVPKVDGMTTDDTINDETRLGGETVAQDLEIDEAAIKPEDGQLQDGKPYFQFTGDENFDDSDDEAGAHQPDGEAGEEDEAEDDFANAFEVLDLARILLLKRLQEETPTEVSIPPEKNVTDTIRQLQERLADTYDLQAEISLEGERFANAVDDLRAALDLKAGLYPKESSLIAEAHYKLSLALEFSSVTQQKTEDGAADTDQQAFVDEAMREEAAKEMEAAIASCRLRITKEQDALRTRENKSDVPKGDIPTTGVMQQDIDEVKDMVADMEQRVSAS